MTKYPIPITGQELHIARLDNDGRVSLSRGVVQTVSGNQIHLYLMRWECKWQSWDVALDSYCDGEDEWHLTLIGALRHLAEKEECEVDDARQNLRHHEDRLAEVRDEIAKWQAK